MQNSGNSSPATPTQDNPSKNTRNRFALTGRSAKVDPRTDAARRDLADVRLADRVFAPHYAAAIEQILIDDVELRSSPDLESETLSTLVAGDVFEVLELSGSNAWGRAPAANLVGYVPAASLKVST